MDNIKIIKTTPAILDDLVKHSAFTLEGLAKESIKDFVEWIEALTPLKKREVYVTKGKLANSEWGLTGSNAYPNDLTIVSVKLDDMEDFNKVVMPRFEIGARWMDDIYDNNVWRDNED